MQVRIVRVTKRVHEAYFAQLYLTKAYKLYPCTLVLLYLYLLFSFWVGGVGGGGGCCGMCENVQPYIVVTGWTVQCHDRWVMRQSVSVLTFDLQMPSTLQ